jgi:hypothetical protein
MMLLHQNISKPRHPYLVFTSAGDHSNVHYWLKGQRNFDLWITYYGDNDTQFKKIADFYNTRRNAKFPNFHYIYQTWPNILKHYEAIMIMDDDIVIKANAISRLFKIREQYDFWILQPAFDPRGKISHPITQVQPKFFLRYTNFVEVTCPLFRTDKLEQFMKIYDPVLIGWGVDWWFLEVLGPDLNRKVAVIDDITCINPYDANKGGYREISRFQAKKIRIQQWQKIKQQHHLQYDKIKHLEYSYETKPLIFQMINTVLGMILFIVGKIYKWHYTGRFKKFFLR